MIGLYLIKKDLKIKNSRKYLNNISPNIINGSKHLFSMPKKNSTYYLKSLTYLFFLRAYLLTKNTFLSL